MKERQTGLRALQGFIWDDLRYLEAIERTGNLRSAARDCGVSLATLYRRVAELEARAGHRCLSRHKGTSLTPFGRSLAALGKRVRGGLSEVLGAVSAKDTAISGVVSVTTVLALFPLVREQLTRLVHKHPGLAIELHLGDNGPSVRRREVDVALTVMPRPPIGVWGRRVGTLVGGIFGQAQFHAPGKRQWVLRTIDEATSPESAWERQHVTSEPVVARAPFHAVVSLCAAGAGLGLIPRIIADAHGLPEVVAFRESTAHLVRPMWVVSHEDLRRSARVVAVRGALADALRGLS